MCVSEQTPNSCSSQNRGKFHLLFIYIFACTIITPSSRRLNFRLKKEIKKDQIFRVLGISEEETTNKEAETHTHINAESDKR